MNRTLSAIAGLAIAVVSTTTLAAATTIAAIDWSAMTISTTGDLTYAMETLYSAPRRTRVWTWNGDSINQSSLMTKTDSGLTGTVVNSGSELSSRITAAGEQIGGFATGIAHTGIRLNGAGVFTLRVPYEFHLTQDGTYLAKGAISAQIPGTSNLFTADAVIAPTLDSSYGNPHQSGFVNFVLTGNGSAANYTMISYVDTQIQPGVPEPETYAMMVLGVGGIWLARRKRNTA